MTVGARRRPKRSAKRPLISAAISSKTETKASAASDELVTELQQYAKGQTAPYKYPRIIDFVAELPKTNSGKVRRADLRN